MEVHRKEVNNTEQWHFIRNHKQGITILSQLALIDQVITEIKLLLFNIHVIQIYVHVLEVGVYTESSCSMYNTSLQIPN